MSNQAGIRLAVIDTDSAFLTVLGKRLDGSDWEHRVLGGSVPVEELVAMKLNALVVDISVLGPHGWEFLEKVCGSIPGLGVLVCTNQSTVAQRVRGLRLGADDWIAKPCHPEEVMARVEAVVRRRKRAEVKLEVWPVVHADLEIRSDQYQAFVGGREPRPDAPRVRAPPAPGGGSRPGDRARGDLSAGLGIRDGPRRPLGRRLRPEAAPEAPAALRELALHPHPLRDRLPVRSGAGRRRQRSQPARTSILADEPARGRGDRRAPSVG